MSAIAPKPMSYFINSRGEGVGRAAINRGKKGITMKKSLQIQGLLAAMLLAVGGVEAAGLGKMSIKSALGQPLRAEIELLSVQPEELGTVEARLASIESFQQARIQRSEAHGNLRFTIEQRPNGAPYLKVTSTTPIQDPFLDLLIELNWSSGRILREYTVLLDPPTDTRADAAKAPVRPASQAADAGKAVKGVKAEAGEGAPAPQKYGPVKSGETLRGIAGKVMHKDVTLEMMVASLYQANRQAFAQNNMNLLKKGQMLKVPERDEVMVMFSPHQAKKLVREHAAAWNAYRGQVAEQAPVEAMAPSPVTGKIAPAKPQDAATAPAASKDVLKLSKGEPAKGQPDPQTLQRLHSMEEELAAKSRALQEAQDRVAQLERTIGDLQKLQSMQGQQAGHGQPPASDMPAQDVPAAAPEKAAKPKPAVAAPIAPPQEETGLLGGLLQNPLYLGGLSAAVLLSGLLGYMVISSRRRKAMASFEQSILSGGDQFKTAIFRTGAGKTVGGATTQGPMTELSRLGLGAIDTHEVDPIAEAEVYMAYGRDAQAEEILKAAMVKDPNRHEIQLKLLEIYAGRQDKVAFETQASELYAALGGQPTPVWTKAAEMGRSLDPANPLYQVVAEAAPSLMETEADTGEETVMLAPGEVTFPGSEPAVEEDHVIEFEIPVDEAPAVAKAEASQELPPAVEAPFEGGASDAPLDFEPMDIELQAPSAPDVIEEIQLEAPDSGMLDAGFGLESLPAGSDLELAPEIQLDSELDVSASHEELPGLSEFDVSEFEVEADKAGVSEAGAADLDFSGIDLDLKDVEDFTPEVSADETAVPQIDPELWEEVNTKMDLAKAYLEMGDREGAREILQEILNEGDDQQKVEAGKLLADTE
jgi:pilus assembly protein FimV